MRKGGHHTKWGGGSGQMQFTQKERFSNPVKGHGWADTGNRTCPETGGLRGKERGKKKIASESHTQLI